MKMLAFAKSHFDNISGGNEKKKHTHTQSSMPVSKLVSSIQLLRQTLCTNVSSFPFVLHVTLFSSFI
jgi:hypothetical protein